jgi:hypothetical protein
MESRSETFDGAALSEACAADDEAGDGSEETACPVVAVEAASAGIISADFAIVDVDCKETAGVAGAEGIATVAAVSGGLPV